MNITKQWLKEKNACKDGYEYALKILNDNPMERIEFLNILIKDDKLNWANWVIVRTMKRKQYLKYAIFSAELVIAIYEKKYPNNDKPRKAIEAAKKVLENDNKENRAAAAAYSAAAAYAAADAAADAAVAAAYSAAAAYAAADAAADAAVAAAYAAYAAYAAADAKKKNLIKILNYGIELLKG